MEARSLYRTTVNGEFLPYAGRLGSMTWSQTLSDAAPPTVVAD
jgi:hypothetical protein